MSIAGKHWYRFNYLKSEEWQNIRVEILARFDATCQICGGRDLSNDVHHIWYDDCLVPANEQTTVLCRQCHSDVHEYLPPSTAKTEREKLSARRQYDQIARSLKSKKHLEKCSCCDSMNCLPVDPISKTVKMGATLMLCTRCRDALFLTTTPSNFSNSSAAWDHIKGAMKMIRAINQGTYIHKQHSVVDNPKILFYCFNC